MHELIYKFSFVNVNGVKFSELLKALYTGRQSSFFGDIHNSHLLYR